MEEAKSARQVMIRFHCWNCSSDAEMNLADVQKERVAKRLSEVKPASEGEPKKYFVRCPSCSKWNTIRI